MQKVVSLAKISAACRSSDIGKQLVVQALVFRFELKKSALFD
jgi:hypothetical protein